MIDTGIGVYSSTRSGGIPLLLYENNKYIFAEDDNYLYLKRLLFNDHDKFVTMVAPKELLQWQD